MGQSLCLVVHNFYESDFLLREMNHANIVLIPQCSNPISIHQFRPISLCKFTYKVIAKMLVNRKSWMSILIPADQSYFIPSQAILQRLD